MLSRLKKPERRRLNAELGGVLERFGFNERQRERLRNGLHHTRAQGSADAIREYLAKHNVRIEEDDVRWWSNHRGMYLHEGVFVDEPDRRHRLEHAVGACLSAELDRHAPAAL